MNSLIKIALVSLLLVSATSAFADDVVKTVGADDFFTQLEEARDVSEGTIIDIRTPGEFDRGHAPGALNIDYYSPDFANLLSELDRDGSYFIYCNSGNRSGRSLSTFRKLGFSEVYDLAGGWSYNSERLSRISE